MRRITATLSAFLMTMCLSANATPLLEVDVAYCHPGVEVEIMRLRATFDVPVNGGVPNFRNDINKYFHNYAPVKVHNISSCSPGTPEPATCDWNAFPEAPQAGFNYDSGYGRATAKHVSGLLVQLSTSTVDFDHPCTCTPGGGNNSADPKSGSRDQEIYEPIMYRDSESGRWRPQNFHDPVDHESHDHFSLRLQEGTAYSDETQVEYFMEDSDGIRPATQEEIERATEGSPTQQVVSDATNETFVEYFMDTGSGLRPATPEEIKRATETGD